MSSARERRDIHFSEETNKRVNVEDLLDKYRPVFDEIGDVIISYIRPTEDRCECSCSNTHCDPIGDRVSRKSLEAIKEIVNRWSEDIHYSSDDAMDAVSNVIESLED